jgi:hypothetical protein
MKPKFTIQPKRPETLPGSRKQPWQMSSFATVGLLLAVAVFVCLEFLRRPASEPDASAASGAEKPPLPSTVVATAKPADAPPVVTPQEKPEPVPVPEAAPQVAETRGDDPVPTDEWAAEPPLVLTGMDATRDAAMKRDQELLDKAINNGAMAAYRELLAKSIRTGMDPLAQGQGPNRFDPVWKEAMLYRALLRWKTLGVFLRPGFGELVKDSYSGAYLLWLLGRTEAMEELLLTIQPTDDSLAVLKLLMDTWSLNDKNYEKYHPLALACAVVFDNPVSIPHPTGSVESGSQVKVDPAERYLWYVEKNEKGKLAAPVHHSSARDLVWVVCAPVSTSELDWAIRKLSGHRKNWGRNYGEIEYLMERAVNGFNPYKEYTFAEILKHGGVCGDQTYYCVNTARAQGIPAMGLSGETDSGGHAWAGLKIDDREWTTGIGRIGGVSKGEAHNPQTGNSITEQEILHWNDRQLQSPAITLSVSRHLWLADLFSATGQDGVNAETIRLANKLGPSFPATWQALYTLLESEMELTGDPAKPNNLDEWKSFAAGMRRQFLENPRMAGLAASAEMEYIFPYGPAGDAERTLLRERRRIQRESAEQADLIAGSLKRQADLIHQAGGPDVKRDIARLYDRALRDYGGSITGFKDMAEDYFSFMRDDPSTARKAARDIELAFKRVVETGTKDWFRAQTESSIYKMICGYYRTAGDTNRAEMLEKRYQILLRRAERSAL